MIFRIVFLICLFWACNTHQEAQAGKLPGVLKQQRDTAINHLTPHKALYDIQLTSTRSGSQLVNISGQMFYEWRPTCDAWITDHRFSLFYEYSDAPGMKMTSDFSTFETFDGEEFSFFTQRKRNKTLFEEYRGKAHAQKTKRLAQFTVPEGLTFDLDDKVLFPMRHTAEMALKAKSGKRFYNAVVFDGSDGEGPIEINAFIGKTVNPLSIVKPSDNLDMTLLNNKAWKVRMAVFPVMSKGAEADYEMDMVFHENGVISDMVIDYDDFAVSQKLIALEKMDESTHTVTCH